ncbi:MAG: TMEM175 family protein [Steroidobacteraceae bacterium]
MNKNRLEAFSDGVIAILITIMVLDLKMPHGSAWAALEPLAPVLFTYLLSFLYLGIYWNNHHHMLHATRSITGGILWANLHLLFWLSLIPATTAWVDESRYAPVPTALYGTVLLMAAIAYWILQQLIIRSQGADSLLKRAVRGDWKGKLSPVLYAIAVLVARRHPPVATAIYALVALMWLVPDRRIERALTADTGRT